MTDVFADLGEDFADWVALAQKLLHDSGFSSERQSIFMDELTMIGISAREMGEILSLHGNSKQRAAAQALLEARLAHLIAELVDAIAKAQIQALLGRLVAILGAAVHGFAPEWLSLLCDAVAAALATFIEQK